MAVGRFLCVGLPYGLTIASLICILITMLAGVADKNLDLFSMDVTNLSISSSDLKNFENLVSRGMIAQSTANALNGIANTNGAVNITASDLGIADSYKVYLWNYCYTTGSNTTCTKAKFDFASSELNISKIDDTISSNGFNVSLPTDVRDALNTFKTVSKWTQVVYIIAILTTVLELVVGCFAFCSRVGSCCTYIVSAISTVAIICASILATVEGAVVVSSIKASTKAYGATATLDSSFLGITWLAVAFSVASGLFWLFSICCCAPSHRKHDSDGGEKMLPTRGYQRVDDPAGFNANTAYGPQTHGGYNSQPAQARTGEAYEPYSRAGI
jgi:hypothetical protein